MRAPPLFFCFGLCFSLIGCSFDPPKRPVAPVDVSWDTPDDQDTKPDTPPTPVDEVEDLRPDVVQDVMPDVQRDPVSDLVDEVPDVYVPNIAMCDEVQVDLNSDAEHCGACGVKCDSTYGACENGVCGCAPEGMKACLPNNACEDTQLSPLHCGECGVVCGAGAWCKRGACECLQGFTLCNGQCVDLAVDPANCGACGNSCEGNACRQGECRDNNRCPIVEGRCRVNDRDGVACLSESQFDNPLYCREDFNPNSCGRQCRGDQLCTTPSIFLKRECFDFRPALGCTSCANCNDCAFEEFCNDSLSPPDTAYCVRK